MQNSRRLVIIRHAKAEPYAPTDVERVLADRGRVEGRMLGEWLAAEGVAPDAAYVSYAARTRETWDVVAAGAGWTLVPEYDGNLYGTDEEGVLDLVRGTKDDAATVVVVGHNPTMGMLVQLLDDGEGAATGSVALGSFPTSTAAIFTVDGAWADLAPMAARLDAFHVARA
ncbi:phosphohistidine phosphatase [Nocardioides aromaticivorans]|uniref:Phosphohistidine phosphatase n=1 Tax=Nocardioides aromaticivorans TaxID=200618 RepID=A0A7Z0CNH3_9ACTN|nr:histidine phosphatase family protein [Nocardioides aromaticivorans]NYI47399.1 phosphohistidine phosphatase [Nocardioides aromaticivorans]